MTNIIQNIMDTMEKYDDKKINEEIFNELQELSNTYFISNGASGRYYGYTWYSAYVVEDGVDYDECTDNYIEEYNIYVTN